MGSGESSHNNAGCRHHEEGSANARQHEAETDERKKQHCYRDDKYGEGIVI
jgi:hypothetical protein